MRTYEIVYIAVPNTSDDDISKLNTQLEHVINELGGTVTKTDIWGRKKLAYQIDKFDEGIYVVLYVEGSGKEIAEAERRLRVTDTVIRHLTVRTDEDLKRAAKLKSRRKVRPANFSDTDLEEGGSDDSGDTEPPSAESETQDGNSSGNSLPPPAPGGGN